MQQYPLLQTKLYIPPVRPGLITRPHLIERLSAGLRQNEGFGRKLTLISAPAGFGKTTLMAEWVAECSVPVAWLSLDEEDSDLTRFWSYIIGAIQTVVTPPYTAGRLGNTALTALQSPQPPPIEAILVTLINSLSGFPEPLILLLDDYHVITAHAIHQTLGFFLDHLPPQMHLVVATRSDPPLNLSRLRGRSELTEIRAEDLCFTFEESTQFLNTCMDLDLLAEDIAKLVRRTEGWITGLQMAALSLQQRSDSRRFVDEFAGDDRYIVDYLAEEVLQRQPTRIQDFLLQTSVLEILSGPLCDAVSRREDSQAILDELERANLFIVPLDNHRQWYRYHRLFADLLQQRLREHAGEQALVTLHRRASIWYEDEGSIAQAMSHALSAPDYERAADLLEHHAAAMIYRGETTLLHRWLEELPGDLIHAGPWLCIAYAWTSLLSPPRSLELAEQWLVAAEQALAQKSAPGEPIGRDSAEGQILTLRALIAGNRADDLEIAIDLAHQALERLPEDTPELRGGLVYGAGQAHLLLGNQDAADAAFAQARHIGEASSSPFLAIAAASSQVAVARARGQLRKAVAICREALRTIVEPAERAGWPLTAGESIHGFLGSILLEWNDLEAAEQSLARALRQIDVSGIPGVLVEWQARLRRAQGNVASALETVERTEQLHPAFAAIFAAVRAWLRLFQTEDDPSYLDEALRWARDDAYELFDEERTQPRILFGVPYDAERLILARILIAQQRMLRMAAPTGHFPDTHDLRNLLQFLDRQIRVTEAAGWTGTLIELLILQALARQEHALNHRSDASPALASLERALALAEPAGYFRIFVDEGAPMARLLTQAAARGITPSYAHRLLAALDASVPAEEGEGSPVPDPQRLVEPLSRRELEVLHLLATELSGPEIAQNLVISVTTVRSHTRSIYGKLGVHSRYEAVARARELGLL
jgi:LuxR family maltose regulon positive regulatory protein